MKGTPLITLLLTVTLFACHKKDNGCEDCPEPDPDPVDTTYNSKSLLSQTVYTSGADVTTMTYQYDTQNKLVWYANTSTKSGYIKDTTKIMRDNNGIITQIIYRSDSTTKFPDPKLDSVVYSVFSSGTKYTYKLLQYTSYNVPFKDSTVYTYNAQGRIITENAYYFDYKTTKTYQQFGKTDYTYDEAGNMTKLDAIYYKVTNTTDYPFQTMYTYDTKGVNLLNLGNEAIIIGMQQKFGAHNIKTLVSTFPQSPQFNRNTLYRYIYNTNYRPLRAEISDKVTGSQGTMVFTYQ